MAGSTNITRFSARLSANRARIRGLPPRVAKLAALRALSGLVYSTRVDTGRARGNWRVGEQTPPTGQVDRFDATGTDGNVDTIREGSARILSLTGEKVIWIHNGVLYIGVLDKKDRMLRSNYEALRTWLAAQGFA